MNGFEAERFVSNGWNLGDLNHSLTSKVDEIGPFAHRSLDKGWTNNMTAKFYLFS